MTSYLSGTKTILFLLGMLGMMTILYSHNILWAQSIEPSQNAALLKSLSEEIKRLRHDLLPIQKSFYASGNVGLPAVENQTTNPTGDNGGNGLSQGVAGRLQINVQQLEAQMRKLNGRLEELEFQIGSLAEQLNGFNRDIQFRFEQLEKKSLASLPDTTNVQAQTEITDDRPVDEQSQNSGLGQIVRDENGNIVTAPASPDQAQNPQATNQIANISPQAFYDGALNALQSRDFARAEVDFTQFLTQWPQDKLAGNAQYWLGETYYAQTRFEEAANEFINTYTNYRDSVKSPDALLKLAMSLDNINRRTAACEALATLSQEYEDAPNYIKSNSERLKEKFTCT